MEDEGVCVSKFCRGRREDNERVLYGQSRRRRRRRTREEIIESEERGGKGVDVWVEGGKGGEGSLN